MHWKSMMWMVALLGICSGCFVQSLHPFYIEETRIEFPEIEGRWQLLDKDGSDEDALPWVFRKNNILTYNGEIPSEIEVRYFDVDGRIFADWTAGELDDKAPPNLYWTTHVVPTHSVFRADVGAGYLILIPLDVDWLQEKLEAGALSLPHMKVDDDRILITATPQMWTVFLMEYGDDLEAFDPDADMAMHFRSVQPDPGPEVEEEQ
jgi:hypothetical protein